MLRSKRTLVVLAVITAPLVIVFALLPRLIPADRLRDLASERIAAATGGEVRLGEASVRIFPRLVVRVADGSLVGTGAGLAAATAAENNLERYRVALRGLEIDVALGPLLRRRVETGKITLIAPDIELVTVAADAGEPRDPAAGVSTAVGAAGEPSASLAWGLAVAGVEIRDGHLVWSETPSGRRVEIDGWQQRIAGADLGLLVERLNRFAAPQESPALDAATAAARQPASLEFAAEVARLTVGGFADRSVGPLEDLAVRAVLTLPAAADRLTVTVDQLRWGALTATAGLEIPAAARGDEPTRWSAALPPSDLASLWAALAPLARSGEDPAGVRNPELAAWLADGPITSGKVAVTAAGILPVAGDAPVAERLLPTLDLTVRVDDGRLQLPASDRSVSLAGDLTVAGGRLTAAQWHGEQPEAGIDATLVVDTTATTGAAADDPRFRAGLSGRVDLAAALALVAELLAGTGQEARADSLPALTGSWEWEGSLTGPSLAALADTAAWDGLRAGLGPLQLELTGRGRDFGLTAGAPGAPWLFPAAEFSLRRSAFGLKATGLQHEVAAGALQLSGVLPAEPGLPDLTLQLQLEQLDLDRLTALLRAERRTAQATAPGRTRLGSLLVGAAYAAPGDAAAAGTANRPPGELIPPDLRLAFTVESERLILQRAVYTDAFARGTLQRRVVDIPEIAMRRAGGTITGQAKIDYAAVPEGRLDFAAEAQEVPTAALLEPYAPGLAPFWEGSLSGHCGGDCRLGAPDAILSSLSVKGLLSGNTGIYHAQELLASIAPYLGSRQDLMDIRFRKLRKSFTVADGRLIIDSLRVDGLDTDWLGRGWVGFDGGIDLDLNVKLPPGFTPNLGSLSLLAEGLRGEDGRIALDLKLTGRSARPKVTVDLEPVKAAGQDALEDNLKKGLGGLLDKLKGK